MAKNTETKTTTETKTDRKPKALNTQVNISITCSGSRLYSDKELGEHFECGKNEVLAMDVSAIAKEIAEALSMVGLKAPHRSQSGNNLTISFPVKLEGWRLKKAPVAQVGAKKEQSDSELKASLLAQLGVK